MKNLIKISIFVLLCGIVLAGYGGMCGLINNDTNSGSSATRQISLTSDSLYKCVGNNETATYHVTIHNDSDHSRPIKISGTPAVGNWVVTYYNPVSGTDITSNMTGAEGFVTPAITSTGSYTVQLEVTPVSVTPGATLDTLINASFSDAPQIKDDTNTRTQGVLKPTLFGSYDEPASATDFSVLGNYAYIVDDYSLRIIDVSNPASPTLSYLYILETDWHRLCVSGNYAYISESSGFQIIDVSNSASPTLVGSYNTPAVVYAVAGNYAYASGGGSMMIIDVSNPASPMLTYSSSMQVSDIQVVGNYAYVLYNNILNIMNVSNPASPIIVGSYHGNLSSDVYISGDYAYLACGAKGLEIVNISNSVMPTLVGVYDAPVYPYAAGQIGSVFVSGDYAYATDGPSTLIINISDPSHPTHAGSWSPYYGIHVAGNYAYLLTWGYDWAFGLASHYGTDFDTDWGPGLRIVKLTD